MYDLIIIGSGPAGYSAGIYATRYNLNVLVIGQIEGGMASLAHQVENYPGLPQITGIELMKKFKDQATKSGAKIISDLVVNIKKTDDIFSVQTKSETYKSKTIILAMGTERRKINIPGEKEFLGKGLSYCVTCDGMFFKNKTVAVIGGGDSALQAVIQLSEICKKVYLIYAKEIPDAMPTWVERANSKADKIIQIASNTLTKIEGTNTVEKVILEKEFNNSNELLVDGVFVEIGAVPNSVLLDKLGVLIDDCKYIIVDQFQQTNVKGIFAAGDITTNSGKFAQIITASNEGAIASFTAFKYLKK
jgi:thioredoxin-disulfide reductase